MDDFAEGALGGEKLVVRLDNVFYLNPKWNVMGTFVMTNYRVYFELLPRSKRSNKYPSRTFSFPRGVTCMDVATPLGNIERLKLDELPVPGRAPKGVLELVCKDTRNVRFGFFNAALARRAHLCLTPYVFCDPQYLFAFYYKLETVPDAHAQYYRSPVLAVASTAADGASSDAVSGSVVGSDGDSEAKSDGEALAPSLVAGRVTDASPIEDDIDIEVPVGDEESDEDEEKEDEYAPKDKLQEEEAAAEAEAVAASSLKKGNTIGHSSSASSVTGQSSVQRTDRSGVVGVGGDGNKDKGARDAWVDINAAKVVSSAGPMAGSPASNRVTVWFEGELRSVPVDAPHRQDGGRVLTRIFYNGGRSAEHGDFSAAPLSSVSGKVVESLGRNEAKVDGLIESSGGMACDLDGWALYDPVVDFLRMGVPNERWRLSYCNRDFSLCNTYPQLLCVPTTALITDEDLCAMGRFRARGRIPVMVWTRSSRSTACMLRCSQPCVGLNMNRSDADERYFEAVALLNPPQPQQRRKVPALFVNNAFDGNGVDNGHVAGGGSGGSSSSLAVLESPPSMETVTIHDARPKMNAIGNRLKGKGWEMSQFYTTSSLVFLNIESIHVMRTAYVKVKKLCTREHRPYNVFVREGEEVGNRKSQSISSTGMLFRRNNVGSVSNNPSHKFNFLKELASTDWLHHVSLVLQGTYGMVYDMEVLKKSVVCHCSDGWDRTSQLCSLAQLCLDPFYRTRKGLCILIEKDWCSFGHKFAQRLGHGNADHGDTQRSPIFLQFLDCVFQLTHQFPLHFEFNSFFLVTIAYHMYSCRFGTFLYNNVAQRLRANVQKKTHSLWTYLLSPARGSIFINPFYDPSSVIQSPWESASGASPSSSSSDKLDGSVSILYPCASPRRLVFWYDYFGQYMHCFSSSEAPSDVHAGSAVSVPDFFSSQEHSNSMGLGGKGQGENAGEKGDQDGCADNDDESDDVRRDVASYLRQHVSPIEAAMAQIQRDNAELRAKLAALGGSVKSL